MNDVIEILKQMGATDIHYIVSPGQDDLLTFLFDNKIVQIAGVHCSDSTGGLDGNWTEVLKSRHQPNAPR